MREKQVLWVLLAVLVVVNGALLVRHNQLKDLYLDLRRETAIPIVESRFLQEQEAIVNEARTVPSSFPRVGSNDAARQGFELYLVGSVEDCTNCIEDEITRLNQLVEDQPELLLGIKGYLLDKADPSDPNLPSAQDLLTHLTPAPRFPVVVQDVLKDFPAATTPLVLVVRATDGRILDAHKPIPEDLTKRDAFYARWSAVLGSVREPVPREKPARDVLGVDSEACATCAVDAS